MLSADDPTGCLWEEAAPTSGTFPSSQALIATLGSDSDSLDNFQYFCVR